MKILALAAAVATLPVMAQAEVVTRAWQYQHPKVGDSQLSSEISAYDEERGNLWVVGGPGIQVLSWRAGTVTGSDPITCAGTGSPNSIAIRAGLVAATFNAVAPAANPNGTLCLFDAETRELRTKIAVGATPDMVTFTPNGRFLLVANEAERIGAAGPAQVDPPGSITIIPMRGKLPLVDGIVTIGFPASLPGIRVAPGKTATLDVEPEYITVSNDSKTAWVTLQENNAIAEIDIVSGTLTKVTSLGTKGFDSDLNAIDPRDNDGMKQLRPTNVRSLYQPDSIEAYRADDGRVYLVMANEGDARSDDSDVARASAVWGLPVTDDRYRLDVSRIDGSATDIVGIGGRSFSIRTTDAELFYDSGSLLDAEAIARDLYDDGRSDNKGVEPEGVAIASLGERTLAFIGMERATTGAVAIFDITSPLEVKFIDFIVGPRTTANGLKQDVGPEGLTTFVRDGILHLAVSHEVSHTTTVYQITP